MSEVIEKRPLRNEAFADMKKLRYLKIYSSCISVLESDSKLTIRNGLKFPLKEFPKDLEPKNLIDLQFPYSQIKRLWAGPKVRSDEYYKLKVRISLFSYPLISVFGYRIRQTLSGSISIIQ